ncbi:MAG: aminotransferase class I/II-fold pyridoxal phosphate-dependent enzyme [Saprospiraceae bacterium]|nr:aminotransferase class I/II-fold pyridoxal phosphate-dependent enzyme [Saprospiraceae bacterium]
MLIPPAQRLSSVNTYYFAQKLAEIARMNAEGALSVINLGVGSPDLPPDDRVIDTLHDALSKQGAHRYQPYRAIPELREAFAAWYQRHFGVGLNPYKEILPTIGSKEAVMHISMAFLNPGDEVLVPDPGYPSYAMCARLAGAIDVRYDLNEKKGWLPDLDKIGSMDLSKTRIMWLNYPNMPTGAEADQNFLIELMAFAKTYGILICYDNPYALITDNRPLSIFNADGAMDCALELTSLSKNYNMSGWRIGAVAGASSYIDAILTFKSNMDSGMFRPLQEAAVTALHLGEDWIDELNAQYAERRAEALKLFQRLNIECKPAGNGLFLWGKIPPEYPDATTMSDALLHTARVFITPGHIFGRNGNQYLRISLCSPVAEFQEALQRIERNFLNTDKKIAQ